MKYTTAAKLFILMLVVVFVLAVSALINLVKAEQKFTTIQRFECGKYIALVENKHNGTPLLMSVLQVTGTYMEVPSPDDSRVVFINLDTSEIAKFDFTTQRIIRLQLYRSDKSYQSKSPYGVALCK